MKKIYLFVLICLITFQITRAQVHPYSQCAPHAIVEYPEDYDYHRIECFIEYKSFNSVTLYWGMHDAVGTPICTQIAKMDFSSGEWEAIATLSGDVYSYTVDELEVGGHAYRISILYDHGIVYISDPARLSFGIEPYQIFKDLSYNYPENNLDYIIFQWKVLGTLPLYYTLECNGEILKDHSFEDDMKFPGDQSFIEVYNRSKDEPCVYRIWSMNESGERIQQVGNDIVLDLNSWKAPRNFHAITNDNGYIELRWTMHPDIPYCQYQIERDGEIIATILTDEEYRYEDVNLEMEEGNIHIYRLYIPDCDDGVSLDIFTDVVVKIGEYRPPINFAVQKEDSRAYLTWDLPGGAIRPMYYVVERNGVIIGETGENMYYDDEEYESGIRIYKLYAIHDNGTVFTVTTSSEEWTIALSPTNFSYTIENRNNVVFTWSMHPQGKKPDYYQIRKNGNNIAVLQENVSTHIDANVSIGTYVYELYAYYDNGEIKEAENRLTIEITPAIIENFTYTIEELDNVVLGWEVPGNGVQPESYQIKKGEEVIAELPAGTLTYVDHNVSVGTHEYKLYAHYSNGEEREAENSLTISIEAPIPSVYFDYSVEGNNVLLTWGMEPDDTEPVYYKLECDKHIIPEIPGFVQSYHDIYLPAGNYSYTITAVYEDFELTAENTININITSTGNDTPAKKIVRYSTKTYTFYAIPSCVSLDSISDLDRVTMISQDPLLENFEFRIDNDNQLKAIVQYPQQQRYENDYQYMVGKSVTSALGTVLYTHEGNKVGQALLDHPYEGFTLSDTDVARFGAYNELFNVDPSVAETMLGASGFQVHEEGGLIIGVNDSMEVSFDFVNLTNEIQFFSDNQMDISIHTEYIEMEGYILPVKETEITYNLLPSEIPYQITKVKSYLSYNIAEGESEDVVVEINNYEDTTEGNPLHKSNKYQEIQQFDEIQKRETELKIYPNPAQEHITIVLPFYMNENVEIKVYNTIGIAVLSQQHTKGQQITMDIHSLPAGTYVVRCIKNDKMVSKLFVKQ